MMELNPSRTLRVFPRDPRLFVALRPCAVRYIRETASLQYPRGGIRSMLRADDPALDQKLQRGK